MIERKYWTLVRRKAIPYNRIKLGKTGIEKGETGRGGYPNQNQFTYLRRCEKGPSPE